MLRRRGAIAAAGQGGAFADTVWDALLSPSETVYVERVSADQYNLHAQIGRACWIQWSIGLITTSEGGVTPVPHQFLGEITQYPVLSMDDTDVSFTFTGTGWDEFGGSHYSSTSGDYAEWTTPDGVTCVGLAPIRATNRGYALVEIDGDPTAANLLPTAQDEVDAGNLPSTVLVANGGALNPTDRLQNHYNLASSSQHTMLADDLAAGVHTVRWTVTGYKLAAASDARVSINTAYYGGSSIASPATSGAVRLLSKNILPIGTGSVYEYAYYMRGPSGTIHWIGNWHGYEAETGLVIKVDGDEVTMTDGQILSGTEVQIISDRDQYHEDYDSATTPVGSGTCSYIFSQQGLQISHHIDWSQTLTPVTAYPAMMTVRELSGDVRYEPWWRGSGSAVDHDSALDKSDASENTVGESATTWMWSPGGNLAIASRAADLDGELQDFAYADTDKVFIQDRDTGGSGGTAINKTYYTLMSNNLTIGTMPDVGNGSTWWGDTTYRVGLVASADDLCSRGLPD